MNLSEITVFANFEKALKCVERGRTALIGANKEDLLLGALFEDKFVFAWALSALNEEGKLLCPNPKQEEWVEIYTIRLNNRKAWVRLVKLIDAFASNDDPELGHFKNIPFNNWSDMAKAIRTGKYCANLIEDHCGWDDKYTVTEEVLSVVHDVTDDTIEAHSIPLPLGRTDVINIKQEDGSVVQYEYNARTGRYHWGADDRYAGYTYEELTK